MNLRYIEHMHSEHVEVIILLSHLEISILVVGLGVVLFVATCIR
jgi:hypothetical protein